ncbi:MAG: ABC transporter ATP-binding protein, partial [Candidatus Methylacidiphilales bacterium]
MPYISRYWFRFSLGVFLGVLFGLSNALFISATTLIINRLGGNAEVYHVSTQTARLGAKALRPPTSADHVFASIRKYTDPIGAAMEKATNDYIPISGSPVTIWQIVGGIMFLPALSFMRGMLGYFSSYCMAWTSRMVMIDLKNDVFRKLNSLSFDYHDKTSTGDHLLRVNGDTGALYGCLSLGLSDLIKEPITLLSVFVTLWFMDWKLTVISLVFLPMCLLPTIMLGRKVRRIAKEGARGGVMQADVLVQNFANIRIVKAFGLEKRQEKIFYDTVKFESRQSMRAIQQKEMLNPIIETLSSMGIGVVLIYVFMAQQSAGNLVGFLTGLAIFYAPLKKLAGIHMVFQQCSAGIDRLLEINRIQPTVVDAPDAKSLDVFKHSIEFKNVTFGYSSHSSQQMLDAGSTLLPDVTHKLVHKNLSFTVPKGTKIGIAGETGAGKTTLLNQIFRFYDVTAGAIEIDGVDIRKYKIADLRKQLALVTQDIQLFDTTIAHNISSGRPGCTQEEIVEAAKNASAHEFIMQQPNGYDTMIGERGTRLSGGQKQRVSIARAFIRNAPIL